MKPGVVCQPSEKMDLHWDSWDNHSRPLAGKVFSKVKLSLVISTKFEFSRQKLDTKLLENIAPFKVSQMKTDGFVRFQTYRWQMLLKFDFWKNSTFNWNQASMQAHQNINQWLWIYWKNAKNIKVDKNDLRSDELAVPSRYHFHDDINTGALKIHYQVIDTLQILINLFTNRS